MVYSFKVNFQETRLKGVRWILLAQERNKGPEYCECGDEI